MNFYNYLLGLICFLRSTAFKARFSLLNSTNGLNPFTSFEDREKYENVYSRLEHIEDFLAVLEDLQTAAMTETGVWKILREHDGLLETFIQAADSEDWPTSEYARNLRGCDDKILDEGRATLERAAESIDLVSK